MNGNGESDDAHSWETSHPLDSTNLAHTSSCASSKGSGGETITTADCDPNQKTDAGGTEEDGSRTPTQQIQITSAPPDKGVVGAGDTDMISDEEVSAHQVVPDGDKDLELLMTEEEEELLLFPDDHDLEEMVIPQLYDDEEDTGQEVTALSIEDLDPLAEGDEQQGSEANQVTGVGDLSLDDSELPGASESERDDQFKDGEAEFDHLGSPRSDTLHGEGEAGKGDLNPAEVNDMEQDAGDFSRLTEEVENSTTVGDVDKSKTEVVANPTTEDAAEVSNVEDSTRDKDDSLEPEPANPLQGDGEATESPVDDDGKDRKGDETKEKDSGAKMSDDEEDIPMIRMNSSIFETLNDDDDDDEEDEGEGMDPECIQSMMEVEMGESDKAQDTEEIPMRRTPRRQAALVASNTIRKISDLEKGVQDRSDGKKNDDVEYINTVSTPSSRPSSGEIQRRPSSGEKQSGDRQRCHQCKATAPSLIVVRQYGTDIHLCSNNCFNSFRNPDPSFRPLPCAKCGLLSRDTESTKLYFWETMNFCSDLCVGNFQLQIGSTCSTCSKKTPWACMGKYCVRFGSDIRQFCTASCLETYKRNARVCFHCQLDIKKLGNVVLANIPSKNTPKEFCSQDCVEQYIEQNVPNGNRTKTVPTIHCHVCKTYKQLYKEFVTAIMSYKVCSLYCWDKLLDLQMIKSPTKCETCTKFINMDTISISPSFYVATEKKAHGFCSATCKNVFVLKTRQIRPCTSCQVKKYNYDLIQHSGGGTTGVNFAVCSLNCLPKQSQYILNLKAKLSDPSYVPPKVTIVTTSTPTLPSSPPALMPASSSGSFGTYNYSALNGELNDNGSEEFNQDIQIEGTSSLAEGTLVMNGDGTYQYQSADGSEYSVSLIPGTDQLTLQEVSSEEFAQLRDAAGVESVETSTEMQTEGGTDESLVDEMWADFAKLMALQLPEPVELRNKACQVRPIRITTETQTDCGELADMPRIEPKVRVLLVPVPVFIPFPVYTCSQPVPVPFPVGIPVPIPIPIILDDKIAAGTDTVPSPPSPIPLATSGDLGVTEDISEEQPEPDAFLQLTDTGNVDVTQDISEEQPEPDALFQGTDDVEMMDTSEPLEAESDPVPETTSESHSNVFAFGSTNSPMSLGSPSLFKGSSSPAPGSPTLGVRGRGSRSEYGLRAWKLYFGDEDPATLTPETLSEKLVELTQRGTKSKGDRYQPDVLLYFFLGIQQHLRTNGRPDQFFYETLYTPFVVSFTAYAEQEMSKGCCIAKVEEDHVWDANELGPISPGVLLFTLVYYIYKNFGLKTWEEHAALDFSQVKINERESAEGNQERYVTISGITNSNAELVEVGAEPENPYRCLVKLLEFYSSKCESTEGSFYKGIKPMGDPRAEWYCNESLSQMDLYRMLVRAQMICFTPID